MKRTLLLLLAAFALALGLAACGGGGSETVVEQTDLQTETETDTVTDTTTVTDTETSTTDEPKIACGLGALNGDSGLVGIKVVSFPCSKGLEVAQQYIDQCFDASADSGCSLNSGYECQVEQFPEADSSQATCTKSGKPGFIELGFAG